MKHSINIILIYTFKLLLHTLSAVFLAVFDCACENRNQYPCVRIPQKPETKTRSRVRSYG